MSQFYSQYIYEIRYYNNIPEDILNVLDKKFKYHEQVLCKKGYSKLDIYVND